MLLFWSLDHSGHEETRKTLEYLLQIIQLQGQLGIFADAIIGLMSCLMRQERLRISDRTQTELKRTVSPENFRETEAQSRH